MRMPTVADRLAERFVRPLTIDRIRALVAPAIDEARLEDVVAHVLVDVRARTNLRPLPNFDPRHRHHVHRQECRLSDDRAELIAPAVEPVSLDHARHFPPIDS